MIGSGPDGPSVGRDRRVLRRSTTIEEILAAALAIMATDGVGALTMAELARRVSMQPPSLYKYFPSLLAIYDALFRRGQQQNLDALEAGMESAAPGLAAVRAGMVAAGRWAVENPVMAQLLFWRPIPRYEPTPEAFGPAVRIVELLRAGLEDAAGRGELGRGAASDGARLLHQTAPADRRDVRGCLPAGRATSGVTSPWCTRTSGRGMTSSGQRPRLSPCRVTCEE